MKALRFDRFGDPGVLRLETVPDPHSDDANAVVAVRAASINPSDVGNVAGRFPETTLPRTPGRDYSGVVIEGPRSGSGSTFSEPATAASRATEVTPNASPYPSRACGASRTRSAIRKRRPSG